MVWRTVSRLTSQVWAREPSDDTEARYWSLPLRIIRRTMPASWTYEGSSAYGLMASRAWKQGSDVDHVPINAHVSLTCESHGGTSPVLHAPVRPPEIKISP
jgi:hypothetical protein